MSTADFSNHRWVLDVPPGSTVCEVAEKSLRVRIAAVRHFLPLAALRADEDMEYVHQLRVATRRAVAAVKLYRSFLPKKRRQRLCRLLKKIRRAAGTARDCDVMLQRQVNQAGATSSRRFLEELRERRSRAQLPLREIHHFAIELGSLQQSAEWLLEGLSDRACRAGGAAKPRAGKATRFRRWARRQLRCHVQQFFRAEPEQLDDLRSLHEFRIRGKHLRYAMELLAAAFPATFRTQIYPMIEELQEHLGTINDHAVAIGQFRTWRRETDKPARRRQLKQRLQAEQQQLRESLWEFAKWWTPRRSKRTQRSLRKLASVK